MALEVLKQAKCLRDEVDTRLVSTNGSVWVDGLGLVGIWLSSTNYNFAYYGAAQLDGEVVKITEPRSLIADFSSDYAEDGLLVNLYSGINGRLWKTKPETNIWTHMYNYPDLPTIRDRMVRLPDRYLYASGGVGGVITVDTAPLDGSTDWVSEHVIAAENASYFTQSRAYISSAGGGLYWLGFAAGGLALYDADNLQILESYKVAFPYGDIGYLTGIHYSRELNVFIASVINTSSSPRWTEVVVLSMETRPFSLSDPVQLSAPTRGYTTTLETQLLGEHGDYVVDFPIDWSITAGTGQLSATQSLTDNEGKAQIDHIPDNLASSGFTLQAEAQF